MNTKTLNIFFFITIFVFWIFIFFQGITTAIDIWTVSEIFNHCFLVIPGSLYFIYKKRLELLSQPLKPNYWLVIPLIMILMLYTFGYIGDIRLFMHIATFSSLPLLIWMIIGNQAAKKIIFPLYFMLFAIPIGEQLIPYSQELTTDIAVPLLELTGVPIFRNGLYLDIPEGRFLVAEACSGISFLIASFMFGNLYAYLSFQKISKQLIFVVVSIVVPILANAIRVYGIVLTAHLTDMEYAAGADHLIYGGVFYAFILFLLIFIGEKFRDKNIDLTLTNIDTKTSMKAKNILPLTIVLGSIFLIQTIWLNSIEAKRTSSIQIQKINTSSFPFEFVKSESQSWQPSFQGAVDIQQGYIQSSRKIKTDIFIATYSVGEGELISSLNKLYDAERWTLISQQTIELTNQTQRKVKGEGKVLFTKLVSPLGTYRYIVHWYQLSNERFTSKLKLKLYQTQKLLVGNAEQSSILAFSSESLVDLKNISNEIFQNISFKSH